MDGRNKANCVLVQDSIQLSGDSFASASAPIYKTGLQVRKNNVYCNEGKSVFLHSMLPLAKME